MRFEFNRSKQRRRWEKLFGKSLGFARVMGDHPVGKCRLREAKAVSKNGAKVPACDVCRYTSF
jgi:hypothetical protein